jgi:uncharacterized membrane protein YedE/YeeE
MMEQIQQPWPWYVAGILIGLIVPALLILGNKTFGISSNLRHVCAACIPAGIPFFKYDWIANYFLMTGAPIEVSPALQSELAGYGLTDYSYMLPKELFSFESLLTVRGFIIMVVGGFLVGFGTRYAGGCTSGHAIMGLSNLQWPSLVATISFMVGGFFMANIILPWILSL